MEKLINRHHIDKMEKIIREKEKFLISINEVMCNSFMIKDHPFGRKEGEKIMNILDEWAK